MDKSHQETHRQRAELADERWASHGGVHQAEEDLAEQKWKSHIDQHDAIARNLSEYKVQSNEWRASLSDLRSTFAGATRLEALEKEVERRFEDLRALIATEREERRDQQNIRTGNRQGISQTLGIALTTVGVLATILSVVAIVAGLLR